MLEYLLSFEAETLMFDREGAAGRRGNVEPILIHGDLPSVWLGAGVGGLKTVDHGARLGCGVDFCYEMVIRVRTSKESSRSTTTREV
ncbi:MAG: hypothetical protein M2R45_04205 [Verrucomicrobia subdivision 3 bacterium]|nr:hypothetical protein [Limisphaerales bacterium]MCS1417058.1 hypothetical protein [Limisphaerales bacterium]